MRTEVAITTAAHVARELGLVDHLIKSFERLTRRKPSLKFQQLCTAWIGNAVQWNLLAERTAHAVKWNIRREPNVGGEPMEYSVELVLHAIRCNRVAGTMVYYPPPDRQPHMLTVRGDFENDRELILSYSSSELPQPRGFTRGTFIFVLDGEILSGTYAGTGRAEGKLLHGFAVLEPTTTRARRVALGFVA